MKSSRALVFALAAASVIASFPAVAPAQITNGDFEAGGTGWTTTVPPGFFASFPPTGGNPAGHARIDAPLGISGLGCIGQSFLCGEQGTAGSCRIRMDLAFIDTTPDLRAERAGILGRAQIFIDGLLIRTVERSGDFFETIEVVVACGQHQLDLCLEADPGNTGVALAIDNVEAECEPPTSAPRASWGELKARYF